MRLHGVDRSVTSITPVDENYSIAVKTATEKLSKGFNGEQVAHTEPLIDISNFSIPGYKVKPSFNNFYALHSVLKSYSSNIILNAIVNTRSSQVSMYCRPSRQTDKGVGFEVTLKDKNAVPTGDDIKTMIKIEEFLLNTGANVDITRDNFTSFVKKIIRDTYRYDQVNFEKVFDKSKRLHHLQIVDPTTIFYKVGSDGKLPKGDYRYVQVLENRVIEQFSTREMAFCVRNPRSDIEVAGYGMPELEVALHEFIAQENTEKFNDRFFSHGGTTRGVLQIKASQQQSAQALDIFRREWNSSLSGINGSWKIPVISAEDVKFINMTPNANDMQFEKWLNYLINVISSLYGIDPSELNFPNNGGATGSKGGSLNQGNSKEKTQASQNKGLMPLLRFIEDVINNNILSEFGNRFLFQFVGGDSTTELEKLQVLKEKVSFALSVNEARKELGLQGDILGGDIPLNGVIVQRLGQLIQQEQIEYQHQQDRVNTILAYTQPVEDKKDDGNFGLTNSTSPESVSQQLEQNKDNTNGKNTRGNVGKDGQAKTELNANSHGQGGKGKDKDWKKEE